MNLTCLDTNAFTKPVKAHIVRLAIITFAARDLREHCQVFMRYYTNVENISPADIYVLHVRTSSELDECLELLPSTNVLEMSEGSWVRRSILSASRRRTALQILRDRRSDASFSYKESIRLHGLMTFQRELLKTSYTHTLVVDMDEFVLVHPSAYSSLHDYLRRNPQRRTAAPANAFEVQEMLPDESALNWSAVPLLRGQRRMMVAMCGMRKPILSRVPTYFTFSTHNMRYPLYFACQPTKWGSTANCLEPALWLVHIKCVDYELPVRHAALLTDVDRARGNASAFGEYLHRRCGHLSSWRAKCRPGPTLGGRDSPDGAKCQQPFLLTNTGPEQRLAHAEYVPEWIRDRL